MKRKSCPANCCLSLIDPLLNFHLDYIGTGRAKWCFHQQILQNLSEKNMASNVKNKFVTTVKLSSFQFFFKLAPSKRDAYKYPVTSLAFT